MVAPTVLIELLVMRARYSTQQLKLLVGCLGVVALAIFWILVRQQAAVGNAQFLRSMIPHHASAILMCKESNAQDPRIKKLCANIIRSQQEEIDQMKNLLSELD